MQIPLPSSLSFIKEFIEKANSWAEVENFIKEHNFNTQMGASEYAQIHGVWHQKVASMMDDHKLASDIEFWAKGGDFKTHLDGFHAVPMEILLDEVIARGWKTHYLPTGKIINPPNYAPIAIFD